MVLTKAETPTVLMPTLRVPWGKFYVVTVHCSECYAGLYRLRPKNMHNFSLKPYWIYMLGPEQLSRQRDTSNLA